jgi:long-subunit fatty acid transport protein
LSEIFVNGDQIVESTVDYEDIWAISAGYSRPVSDRFTLGLGAAYVDDMISDDQRTLTLRLDSVWVVGIGLGWQWTPTRAINATLNYIETGDAPITSPSIGGIGSVTGAYTDRGTIWLQVSLDIGKGAH